MFFGIQLEMQMIKRSISTLLLALACAGSAHAFPITMQFTAAGFFPLDPGFPAAPTDPVTGTLVWDALSADSPIGSLLSISLTVDGHAYSLAEVGFESVSNRVIGGTLSGVDGLEQLANDFTIVWTTSTMTPDFFSYTSARTDGIWISIGALFTQFSITAGNEDPDPGTDPDQGTDQDPGAVPVPGTLALLAAGAFGFAARRRRSQNLRS